MPEHEDAQEIIDDQTASQATGSGEQASPGVVTDENAKQTNSDQNTSNNLEEHCDGRRTR